MNEFSPVTFDLTKELTMPRLSKVLKFHRQHVLALFEQLEKGGFGEYTKGRRGKGNCARFAPNEKCPPAFTILVETATLPKRKQSVEANKVNKPQIKVTTKQTETLEASIDSIEETECKAPLSVEAQILNSLWSLSKHVVMDSSSSFVGFECKVFANVFIVLNHVRGGGEKTIEEALQTVWEANNDRMGLKSKPKSKRIEWIASDLRGKGFYILDRME
jgi:hypothetical protein